MSFTPASIRTRNGSPRPPHANTTPPNAPASPTNDTCPSPPPQHCTAPLAGHRDSVLSVASPLDGTWLGTTSTDTAVRIWDVSNVRTVPVARSQGLLAPCS
ncbi:WD40 repeat domain-containing protein [Streptomyces liliiviolaceus]|uniref:WD40 repeat domain-containing protein n=1 Tax=Streptomyces liliiviolaceus TaxID=2823109 RepID=UPI00389AA65D